MPTARELLEQADALMRRNRAADGGIPVLTDIVADGSAQLRAGPTARERAGASRRDALREAGEPPSDRTPRDERPQRTTEPQVPTDARPTVTAAGPPTLTDALEEVTFEVPALPPEPAEEESSLWLGPDTVDPALHSITGPAPDTVAVVPPVKLPATEPPPEAPGFFDEPDESVTRTLRAAGSAPTPAPAGSMSFSLVMDEAAGSPVRTALAGDDERWRALAEQISMQVLQRIDLFTDTGLKAQLAAHLEPIVARASAELVEAINDHVGKLIRSYVAEAIEREIAQWREDNR